MPQAVYILFGWLWTVVTASAIGAILFHRLRVRATWPMAFVIGASILSLAVLLIALAGAIYKGVVLAVGALAIVMCARLHAHRSIDPIQLGSPFFCIGFVPFAVLYFIQAMAPEMSPDGMVYHLSLVGRYWRDHRMNPVPWSLYASLSQGIEMLFAFAFGFGRHSASALVHFTYLLALPLLIADYATRRGWPLAGTVAALLVFASPIFGIDGTSAYVDVAVAAIWFALFVLLENFEPSLAIPVGILSGFAYAAKYTAGLALAYALFRLRRDWRSAAIVVAVAALFIVPWMARNYVWLGNPVAPFFNAWFPNPSLTPSFEHEYSKDLRRLPGSGVGDWAWSLAVTGQLAGIFGPMALLAPLGIAEWAWIFPALTYPLNLGARFLIPVFPFLALGTAKILARWRWVAICVVAAQLVLSWPSVVHRYTAPGAWTLDGFPWRAALRLQSEEAYLTARSDMYRTARMVEDFVPKGERVFCWPGIAESYTTRDVVVAMQSAEGARIRDVFATPNQSYLWPGVRSTIHLAKPQQQVRITQTAEGAPDIWSISEIEPRPIAMRASDFPFEMQLAFDGNPLTRWSSGTALHRGMWIDLTFSEPVDTIKLTMTRDQYAVRLKADSPGSTTDVSVAYVWPNLRRWSAETVRGLGIRYFLTDTPDFGYQDFAEHAADWNIELIAERGTVKLYRLK